MSSAIAAAIAAAAAAPIVGPRRGGSSFHGTYLGGCLFDTDYKPIKKPKMAYTTQIRTTKQMGVNQKFLMDAMNNSALMKFDGKLEVIETTSNELDKEQFTASVKNNMRYYGLQTWFYLPSPANKMVCLLEEAHQFSLAEVLANYTLRSVEPPEDLDANGDETDESKRNRFVSYDEFELFDAATSRLAVESCISPALRAKVDVRFSHTDDYDELPGQVYYMMVLECCHASASMDVDTAISSFKALSLASYPGENVGALATDALKQIKVMSTAWSVDISLGCDLLKKVVNTQSEFFNRTIHSKYDDAKKMERKYKLKDPSLLKTDALYATLGPIALCAYLQEEYGSLYADKEWPALSPSRPESNYTPGPDTGVIIPKHNPLPPKSEKNGNNRVCFDCNSAFHLRGNPLCPKYEISKSSTRDKTGDDVGKAKKEKAAWMFIEPEDENHTFTDAGRTWRFCKLCKCAHSGKVGYYNSHHGTKDHPTGRGDTNGNSDSAAKAAAAAAKSNPAPEGNMAKVDSPPGPVIKTTDDVLVDENALQFDGVWMSTVDDDLLYSIDDDLRLGSEFATVTVTPVTPIPTLATSRFTMSSVHVPDSGNAAPAVSSSIRESQNQTKTKSDVSVYFDCSHSDQSSVSSIDTFYDCLQVPHPTPFPLIGYMALKSLDNSWILACTMMPLLLHFATMFSIVTTSVNFMNLYCPSLTTMTALYPVSTTLLYGFYTTAPPCLLLLLKIPAYLRRITLLLIMLIWDTVLYYEDPPKERVSFYSTRAYKRRRKRGVMLRTYPLQWMILSGCLLVANAAMHSSHPGVVAYSHLAHAVYRTHAIETTMDIDFKLLYDFHLSKKEEYHSLLKVSTPPDIPLIDTASFLDCFSTTAEMEGDKADYIVPHFQHQYRDSIDLPGFDFPSLHHKVHVQLDCQILTLDTPILVDSCASLPFLMSMETHEPSDIFSLCDPGLSWHGWHGIESFQWIDSDSQTISTDHFVDCSNSDVTPYDLTMPLAYHVAAAGLFNPMEQSPAFQVIFDSGASKAISGFQEDFTEGIIPNPHEDITLGGMANGLVIKGEGIVQWTFSDGQNSITIRTRCYYVPSAKVRIISPQRLFSKAEGVVGTFTVEEEHSVLAFENCPPIKIMYDPRNHLPIGLGKNLTTDAPQLNLSITSESNQNLSPSQRLLLIWHNRFGHKGFQSVQKIFRSIPFSTEKYLSASRCPLPRCEVCQFAKGHRSPTHGKSQSTNPTTDGALKVNDIRPGSKVSVDHFESRLKGRTYTSFGKTTSDQYVGGCVFVDHMSGYLHVEHQLGFSSSETIRAKQNYEQLALNHGVLVQDYMADNGVFKAKAFVQHIREQNQQVRYCGVNAHHKNSVAERSIRTVSEMARAMVLHSSVRWKGGISKNIWPMAVDYACYVYNHMPNDKGIAPADLFTGSMIPRHKLKDIHVFGCPVYVLDPKLQQGKKLPRWQPRSRIGVFVGFSAHHSSDIPLILNLQTGSISPQFHVVFDDSFSTVISIEESEDPPDFWNDIDLEARSVLIPSDDDDPPELGDDWLTPEEKEEKTRRVTRRERIRSSYIPPQQIKTPIDHPVPETPKLGHIKEIPVVANDANDTNDAIMPSTVLPSLHQPSINDNHVPLFPAHETHTPSTRVSSRSNKGQHSTRYIDEVFLSSVNKTSQSSQDSRLAYVADLSTDFDTGLLNCTDPRAYVAKTRNKDPDTPTYQAAMTGPHADEYRKAMELEIRQLLIQRTWNRISRDDVPTNSNGKKQRILPGTWAFKLKRLPDGTPLKFKARYCVRGDLQTEGVDYFDTYAPVVQWSTIRMILSLTLSHGWSTKQVDYTNAFAQADINEEVYIEQPRGFSGVKDKSDKVLHLLKSLYGLKQAPRTFYQKLKAGLEERGFVCSDFDACLFMKKDMICICYVDDTILCGPDSEEIEKVIKSLGVHDNETRHHSFQLRDEGEVGDFLGIRITKENEGKFTLTQTGLIDKVIAATKMESCNTVVTPAATTPLGIDEDGKPFDEDWEYASIIGILMYLANNSRPDIAYAVHQAARFTHCPRDSHATGVKRIVRYLRGTRTKGMTIAPSKELQVDCYVDADFAGLWNIENDQDPVCVKSRTGFIIMFMNCPLLWVSKLQTLVALSTMEAEYIALSQAMRSLIPIRETIKEMKQIVFLGKGNDPKFKTHAKTFIDIPASIVHEDNEACLKFATMPKMSPRTKHIAIPYHFFRSKVEELEIIVQAIGTDNQLADQFTKGLPGPKFVKDRYKLMGW
jgi:hypothetical protein